MTPQNSRLIRQAGFSIVELLVAIAIGLLLLAGLTLVFVNSSEASRELQKTAQQIENGRFATDALTQDLHHAGFYGHMYSLPAAGALPDPCDIINTDAKLQAAIPLPVQGYRAPDLASRPDISATTCGSGGWLTNANLKPGSDVLVVRRASTQELTGASLANEAYIQATNLTSKLVLGNGSTPAAHVDATLLKKDGTKAPVRKFMVHVYFVAPCSVGSASNGACTGGASEDSIPTLKRLELRRNGLGNLTMNIVPLVEGIEYFKVEYGVDNFPATVNPVTGLNGDSTVDTYTASPATVADWTAVIAARVYLLARNTESSADFTDSKTYVLGSVSVTPAVLTAASANALRFKRHVFTSAVRLVNPAGRKEIP